MQGKILIDSFIGRKTVQHATLFHRRHKRLSHSGSMMCSWLELWGNTLEFLPSTSTLGTLMSWEGRQNGFTARRRNLCLLFLLFLKYPRPPIGMLCFTSRMKSVSATFFPILTFLISVVGVTWSSLFGPSQKGFSPYTTVFKPNLQWYSDNW